MDQVSQTDLVVERSHLPFPVVGIGASAGGLVATRQVLERMPKEPGMAFVVVMHLSPRHESTAAEILQAATPLVVKQVKETTSIERNVVYVISPKRSLAMSDGKLVPLEGTRARRPVVIDRFFQTLAEAHRNRAIGIVLSGSGSDGSTGIRWLKQAGGVVIAQSPDDAEHDGMPRAAIATGHVDAVLPAADIARRLTDLWANAQHIEIPSARATGLEIDEPVDPRIADDALRDVLLIVRQRTGHDFKHYKRASLLRRLERRLQVNDISTLPAYREYLAAHAEETQGLFEDLLVGVTQFFRDRPAFEALEREVVGALLAESRDGGDLRVWVAGASSGEEAYSLSILLADEARRSFAAKRLTLFATDIDERSLKVARAGFFGEAIVADIPPAHLRQYFTKENGGYRIARPQRDVIVFARHNVLSDAPFSKLDLVSCRNLLIYLDRDAQREVLSTFHFALRPGGYLFLGSSETVDATSELFEVVDKTHRIYRSRPISPTLRELPQFAHARATLEMPPPFPVRPRTIKLAELHQRLLDEAGPASIVLSMNHEILHASARVGDFLRFSEGTPSTDVITAIHPALRRALRVCLYEAMQSRVRAESQAVPIVREGTTTFVRMSALTTRDAASPDAVILLTFDELPKPTPSPARGDGPSGDPVLAHLEDELLKRTEQWQITVEQYETAAEELTASNEEFQAINEELRVATEELETSREELQSLNEELITVNTELKAKVEETKLINDDLNNLIAASDIATIFVDEHMRIKRFTPAAAGIFALRPVDVGRALFDITYRLDYPGLPSDAQTVLDSLERIERKVQTRDSRWFLARLLPYRTGANNVRGLVLTFIDLSGASVTARLHRDA